MPQPTGSDLHVESYRKKLEDHRVRHAWHSAIKSGRKLRNSDGTEMTMDRIVQEHAEYAQALIDEKNLQHFLIDELDETLSEEQKKRSLKKDFFRLPRDVMVVKDYVCIVGSSVHNAEGAADLDLLIRSSQTSGQLMIQQDNVLVPIRKVLSSEKDKDLHWIFNPQGPHADAIPLYDLVLRKRDPVSPVMVKELIKIDLGCGENKPSGYVGIDKKYAEGVDLVWDLENGIPYPDNAASVVRAIHSLEHLSSPDRIMREIHRVLVDGGVLEFEVPSTRGEGAFAHPDHKSLWNKSSFAFWSVPELLGDRPRFAIESLEQEELSDEKVNVRGRLLKMGGMFKGDRASSLVPIKTSFIPPKPIAAFYTDAFSGEDLWDKWASGKELPMYVEPKWNSFRAIVEKQDDEVRIWLEGTRSKNRVREYGLEDLLKKIDRDFILDCAVGIKRGDEWLPRVEMMQLTSDRVDLETGERIVIVIFDLPYLDEDLHSKSFEERRSKLEQFFNSAFRKESVFELSASKKCASKMEVLSAIKSAARVQGSEGAMVKVASGNYPLGGAMDSQGKVKNVLEIKAQVLDVQRNKNDTYSYHVGVRKGDSEFENVWEDSDLINLGKTFSTKIKASNGDILTIEVEEIIPQNRELSFLGPKVIDVDQSRSDPYSAPQIIEMASRSSVLQKAKLRVPPTRSEVARSFWRENWHEAYPKSGKGRFVYQHHWRGLSEEEAELSEEELLKTNHSVHGDLRLEADNGKLYGWSVFLGTAEEVRGGRDLFSLGDGKLQCTPKLYEPHEWLTVAKSKPYVAGPGEAGSTFKTFSKIFEIDSGTYDVGVWREHFFETFMHGSKVKGRMLVQFAPVGGSRKWLISMEKNQKPYADQNDKDKVFEEIESKGQDYLIWAKPGVEPEKLSAIRKVLFLKKDKSKQIVFGIVAEPDEPDAVGEWCTEEDIEEALHDYMIQYRETKLSHREGLGKDDVAIVQAYQAPVEFSMGGQLIKKGTWVMAHKVFNPEIWRDIEDGKIVGYSMGGTKQILAPGKP